MTIKAQKIEAIRLQLADGIEAVLVQEGEEWNGLVEFRCVAPPAMVGQSLIARPDDSSSSFAVLVSRTFGRRVLDFTVLAATPALGEVIKAIEAEASRGA